MDTTTILDLNQFCYFELFKQIKRSCERDNASATQEEMKYVDLINFTVANRLFRYLFGIWDLNFSKRLFLLYVSSEEKLSIDFAELYERLKESPEKVKQSYWKSLMLAIEENDRLTSVELRYYPESHHREHLDVFESVMNQLRRKKCLKALRMHVAGYTLEDLRGFGNLEQLALDMKTDIEELTRCCRENGSLNDLSITNSHTAGRRLTEIVPFCCQIRVFGFKMKSEGDAAEYASLAKMPRLKELRIGGEHEQGTLQPLFVGLTRKVPELLTKLSIEDAPLNWEESTELAQIETLTDLRCRFLQPESIGPLAQLNYLNYLEILSRHEFSTISAQIYTILEHSMRGKKVVLADCLIDYEPGQNLHLILRRGNASDYSSLVALPGLEFLKISGYYKPGSLVRLFEELATANVTTLIIDQDPRDHFLNRDCGKRPYKEALLIDSHEIAALSQCKSLTKIVCGISQAGNVELLARLPHLQELIITRVPFKGCLQNLFEEMVLAKMHTLQHFELRHRTLNSKEISALSLLATLKSLTVSEVANIKMFSTLELAISFEKLNIFSYKRFHEVREGILKLLEVCQFRICISTHDFAFVFDPSENHLEITKLPGTSTKMEELNALTSLEWVESLDLDLTCNLKFFFHNLALKTDCRLKKIRVKKGALSLGETLELGKIKSLRVFLGKLTDNRSLDHLCHLSFLGIAGSTGNKFPACLLHTLDSIGEELTIRLIDRQISYNTKTGHLIIHNSFPSKVYRVPGKRFYAKRPTCEASDLTPLASLRNLKSVQIYGNHKEGTLQPFFAQLASRPDQTFQEVAMEKKNRGTKLVYSTLNSSEIREVASIKSLRRLKCGFSECEHIELLSQLPQLTEMVITAHEVGSLRVLLEQLSSRSCSPLENLVLQEGPLTPEEKVELTALRLSMNRNAACPA